MYFHESFVCETLCRNSPPTQARTWQVVRGVIGFSFQLAIIQHQLKKLHTFEYCHLHEDRKIFKCTKISMNVKLPNNDVFYCSQHLCNKVAHVYCLHF